jgi:hypothetical protein
MAAVVADAVFDAALDELATATRLVLCSQVPTTYTEAYTTYKLAEVTIDSSDFTKANGDTSGRKTTLGAQTVTGSANGTATHFALVRVSDTTLLHNNTMTNVAITNAVAQDVNAVKVLEILDPT